MDICKYIKVGTLYICHLLYYVNQKKKKLNEIKIMIGDLLTSPLFIESKIIIYSSIEVK